MSTAFLIEHMTPHAAALEAYVPYSFPLYFGILFAAFCVRKISGVQGSLVSQPVQFVHNVFLALQSAFLMYVMVLFYSDTEKVLLSKQVSSDINEYETGFFQKFFAVMTTPVRTESEIFPVALVAFLASKLYETLDTVILILNGKPLLLLHVWHHATTYLAFYQGLFTAAGFWIGMLNSFIHVVMYLYYAKIPGMKQIAKYITSMQIFHLFGGLVWNLVTFYQALSPTPGEIAAGGRPCTLQGETSLAALFGLSLPGAETQTFGQHDEGHVNGCILAYSACNAFICFSYFFLFLAFFSKKYHKNGSVFTLFHVPKPIQKLVLGMQKAALPAGVCAYLQDQGLLVREGEGGKKDVGGRPAGTLLETSSAGEGAVETKKAM